MAASGSQKAAYALFSKKSLSNCVRYLSCSGVNLAGQMPSAGIDTSHISECKVRGINLLRDPALNKVPGVFFFL